MDKKEMTVEERLTALEELFLQQKKIFTLDEASAYTHISKSRLYKLTSEKMIPHYKPTGRFLYFEKDELDQWIKNHRVSTVDEMEEAAQSYCVRQPIATV